MLRHPSRQRSGSPAELRGGRGGGTACRCDRVRFESWTPGLGLVLPSGAETRPGVQLVRRTARADTAPRTLGALQDFLCGRSRYGDPVARAREGSALAFPLACVLPYA